VSFDVFLQRFERGRPVEATTVEILRVLDSTQHTGPDAYGFYKVQFPDGAEVEFSAKGLGFGDTFPGCAFHIRASSALLADFVLEVARAGGMTIMPAMGESLVLLPSEEALQDLPPDIVANFRPVILSNSAELLGILEKGCSAWLGFLRG